MSSYDEQLGQRLKTILSNLSIETPQQRPIGRWGASLQQTVTLGHRYIMEALGLDLKDDSLRDTPDRVAKMYCDEIFAGLDYSKFPKCTTVENKMKVDELVTVHNVDVLSMCEHHFVPFVGTASVGYIPSTKLLGLSKIPRVVDFFCRRPQIQERLTEQIYAALAHILETEDIAVVMRAEHMCMRLRGVKQSGSYTTTSKMGGRFMQKPELRQEFLELTRKQ